MVVQDKTMRHRTGIRLGSGYTSVVKHRVWLSQESPTLTAIGITFHPYHK